MSDELLRLAAECEALSGPSRDLDWVIADAVLGKVKAPYRRGKCEHYTASLDAAMLLVPQECDCRYFNEDPSGTSWTLATYTRGVVLERGKSVTAGEPVLALVAASLRARASRLRMEVE